MKMEFGYTTWLPQTELVKKFIKELENKKLMGTRCKKCGTKYLPPRSHCKCGCQDMELCEMPKNGKITAYTFVTFPPESMKKHAPYILAVAELNDGTKLLAHVTDVAIEELRVGLPVRVAVQRISEDRLVYVLKMDSQ